MKSFLSYIQEAERKKPTAGEKKKFKDKFSKIVNSDEYKRERDSRNILRWNLTGHNPDTLIGPSRDIEAMKQKVFGKRRKGTSDLFWIHNKHGLITHPAIGNMTHMNVEDNDSQEIEKGVRVNNKISQKVSEGGPSAILGHGRIEHHEGGGGIISYSHRGVGSRAAMVRTIARAYPKYQIHDGRGNLI
jgi:hypothetical protein